MQREHGERLLLNRTPGVHFLDNVGIIAYEAGYNIDRHLANLLSRSTRSASSSASRILSDSRLGFRISMYVELQSWILGSQIAVH